MDIIEALSQGIVVRAIGNEYADDGGKTTIVPNGKVSMAGDLVWLRHYEDHANVKQVTLTAELKTPLDTNT